MIKLLRATERGSERDREREIDRKGGEMERGGDMGTGGDGTETGEIDIERRKARWRDTWTEERMSVSIESGR